jgi:predicted permease|tara:strand:+ start:385 stop:591 length:207 start_codon:yes stop_codon:yes gene_type:complete
MINFPNIILFLSMVIVIIILAWGLITMARGGEYNKSNSNLIMRYRIVFQAIAIIIFVSILMIKRSNYG